jgi:hypothetical protein
MAAHRSEVNTRYANHGRLALQPQVLEPILASSFGLQCICISGTVRRAFSLDAHENYTQCGAG